MLFSRRALVRNITETGPPQFDDSGVPVTRTAERGCAARLESISDGEISTLAKEQESFGEAMSESLQITRILIIDDDPKLCRLIANYLHPLGYCIVAEHGPTGLNRALTESFDAVILDVMLPGLSGFDVLRELRTQSSVPVLM
jgi:PleD family two-component response regulator